jgi:hypothetical protein
MGFEQIRDYALALPEVTEEPHFSLTSFRIRGKIFATASPDQKSINIFADDMDQERVLAIDPISFEKLWWGAKVVGLKAHIARVDPALILELLKLSWLRKAPNRLKKIHAHII